MRNREISLPAAARVVAAGAAACLVVGCMLTASVPVRADEPSDDADIAQTVPEQGEIDAPPPLMVRRLRTWVCLRATFRRQTAKRPPSPLTPLLKARPNPPSLRTEANRILRIRRVPRIRRTPSTRSTRSTRLPR